MAGGGERENGRWAMGSIDGYNAGGRRYCIS